MKSPKAVSICPPQMPLKSQMCLTAGKFGDNVIQHLHFFSLMWSLLQSLHMQFALMRFLGEDNQKKQKPQEQTIGCCFGDSTPRGTPSYAPPKGAKEAHLGWSCPGWALLCEAANGWWCSRSCLGLLPISCCSARSHRSSGCCTSLAVVLQM